MKAKDPSELDRLRARIDDALRRERPREEVLPLLERLLSQVSEQSELYAYAHRRIAELLLQTEPWRAALHLRRVIKAGAGEDTAHALMGLCQALLGNFDSAVFHYERALAIEPNNAWYHHNLGHLLDVALDMPQVALTHLRWAHDAQPMEDEVTASLSHCLARTGSLEEAEHLAREALDLSPDHESHLSLLSWIRRGAPGGHLFSADQTFSGRESRSQSGPEERSKRMAQSDDDVLTVLALGLEESGAPDVLRSRAELVWRDYRAQRPNVRVGKPEVQAAALQYALSVMYGIAGVTQSALAKRYGVSSTAVASRYSDIRTTLALEIGDPRYLS